MEIVHLVTSLSPEYASPQVLLKFNRGYRGMEIIHCHEDATLGEDGHTNRSDNATRNVFTILCFSFKILKSVSPSPTRAKNDFKTTEIAPPGFRGLSLNRPICDAG